MTGDPATARPLVAVAVSEFGVHDRSPIAALEAAGVDVRMNPTGRRLGSDDLISFARDADGVIAGLELYDERVLAALPRLRFISRCGVGVDNVDLSAAAERGVVVLNTPSAPTEAVAELALTMILALLRALIPQHLSMRRREWKRSPALLLHGRSVVIVGLGRIGRRVADLMLAFGARVCGVDPRADPAWCAARGVTAMSLADGLPRAEVLIVAAAREPRSPLLIGPREIASMPRGSFIVNVARGGLVDEAALVVALRDGQLSGAALDVYDSEPYRGPLCDLENVILTPHAATSTIETRVAMEMECVENAIRALTS